MAQRPGGLTFVFTDIEGSTRLVQELASSYSLALRTHRQMLRTCVREHGGTEMGTEGDGLFFVFPDPADALRAGLAAQRKVEHSSWPDGMVLRVRMGIHCGPVTVSGGEYFGITIHEVARICAAAHGGQVVCSTAVAAAVGHRPPEGEFRDLGLYMLRGLGDARPLLQLTVDDLEAEFPPPREAVRDGGVSVSIWRRDESVRGTSLAPEAPFAPVAMSSIGSIVPNEGSVDVELRRASNGAPGSFRLVVHRKGRVEEEFDGLTIGGTADAATIVNTHSRLVRIQPS